MEVVINGVEYVPKVELPQINDKKMNECLAELVSIQYFGECSHKHRAWAWDAMNAIALDVAELCSNDIKAAYNMFHKE